MSRTVDLFIDSDQPLPQLAERLSELVGQPLSASGGQHRYALVDGNVNAYLSEHDFLDDDDLPLSEFRYVLSAAVRGPGPIEDSPEVCCVRAGQTRRCGKRRGCRRCWSSTSRGQIQVSCK